MTLGPVIFPAELASPGAWPECVAGHTVSWHVCVVLLSVPREAGRRSAQTSPGDCAAPMCINDYICSTLMLGFGTHMILLYCSKNGRSLSVRFLPSGNGVLVGFPTQAPAHSYTHSCASSCWYLGRAQVYLVWASACAHHAARCDSRVSKQVGRTMAGVSGRPRTATHNARDIV